METELVHALFVERYVKLLLKVNMPRGHRELNWSLGWHTTVFEAECIIENTNIRILLESETALEALASFRINWKLVWDYLKSLMILTEYSTALLI
jgi:hypothetical protein